MKNYLIAIGIFTLGFGLGWSLDWSAKQGRPPHNLLPASAINPVTRPLSSDPGDTAPGVARADTVQLSATKGIVTASSPTVLSAPPMPIPEDAESSLKTVVGESVEVLFVELLAARRYEQVVVLYQNLDRQGERPRERLKPLLLTHLNRLITDQNHSDFAELSDLFLAVYYDDLDVLLQLADFHYGAGAFVEAVNVYHLAKTYSYSDAHQQKLLSHFNPFVEAVDHFYTQKADWQALGHFYGHLQTTGLWSSHHQYRQAMVMHNSGDTLAAIESLRQLIDDHIAGEQATASLAQLTGQGGPTHRPAVATPFGHSATGEAVALQRVGKQYAVDVYFNHIDRATLLIDTGAATTTLSRASFNQLTISQRSHALGKRTFQTANGLAEGVLYRAPQLQLGSHLIADAQIAVLEFTMAPNIDGLLGMDILGRFRFHIEQESASLLLDRDR